MAACISLSPVTSMLLELADLHGAEVLELSYILHRSVTLSVGLKLPRRCKASAKTLPVIGHVTMPVQDMQEKAGLEVYTWADFIELGRKHPAEPIPAKPQDLCTIMYTSGPQATPRCVPHPGFLSHSCPVNLVSRLRFRAITCAPVPLPGMPCSLPLPS